MKCCPSVWRHYPAWIVSISIADIASGQSCYPERPTLYLDHNIMPCSALCLSVEVVLLVQVELCFLISESPVGTTMSSTLVTSPNFTPNLRGLAARGNNTLDLTLQIYNYEAVGTGAPRHTHMPRSDMLFFRGIFKEKVFFKYCLSTIYISKC